MRADVEQWPRPEFNELSNHIEGRATAAPRGRVVLSQLPRGRSRLVASEASVKFVLDGEGVYEVDGRRRRLRAGEFMLVEAGRTMTAFMPAAQTTGLCVSIKPGAGSNATELAPVCLLGGAKEPLARLLGGYTRTLIARRDRGPLLAAQILKEVQALSDGFVCAFSGRLERLGAVKLSTRIETLQRLERARSFIHDHCGRPLTLDEIAGHAALSRFHLTRSFAEAYGVPPLQYHRELRLKDAATRIRRGAASPTQVAEDLGYGSLSAFTRAFRQRFGVPPSGLKQVA